MLPRLQLCLHRASLAILTDGRFPEDPGHSHTSQCTTQISSTPKRLGLINKSNENWVTANSQYRVSPKVSVEFLDQSPFLKCRLSLCRFVCMWMVYVYVCVCVHVWGAQRPMSMSVLNLSTYCLSETGSLTEPGAPQTAWDPLVSASPCWDYRYMPSLIASPVLGVQPLIAAFYIGAKDSNSDPGGRHVPNRVIFPGYMGITYLLAYNMQNNRVTLRLFRHT